MSDDFRARARKLPKGNLFDDFQVGQVFQHHWGRTLSASDNTLFSTLTLSYNPLYFNAPYARAHGHRQQALLHNAGQLSDHHRHGLRQHRRRRTRSALLVVLLHSGPLSWVDLAVAQHLPQGRSQAGDRHLNFHETRDNLRRHPSPRCAAAAASRPGTPRPRARPTSNHSYVPDQPTAPADQHPPGRAGLLANLARTAPHPTSRAERPDHSSATPARSANRVRHTRITGLLNDPG